jgi:long-chain acyl-CoA synthetase
MKPNLTLTSTVLLEGLLNLVKDGVDLSYFTYPIAGGEAMPEETERKLNQFFASHNSQGRVLKGWGMCEFGSVVTHSVYEDIARLGTGKPFSPNTVSVFNTDTDEELGYNQLGELRVITPCKMLGYYKNPEATAAFFRKGLDGQVWGCSGDVGYIDEEGNVFVEGRANDFIITERGKKVWLFDIENAILQDPDVQLCEAVGLETGECGVPVAHLVLRPGFDGDANEVISRVHALCVSGLAPEAVPQGYKIRESFGVTPGGKRDTLSLKAERDGFVVPGGETMCEISIEISYNSEVKGHDR